MSTATATTSQSPERKVALTLADLLEQLGGISPERVRADPPPGRATVQDVIDIENAENRHYELIDGTLVEKAMGFRESMIAIAVATMMGTFTSSRNLGLVTGSDGTLSISTGLVRIPDVTYISWARLPGGKIPSEPVPDVVPDLAVEVLSAGNTAKEMRRKRAEYFRAGVRLVWEVDLKTRTVSVYESAERFSVLAETQVLGGGAVLPGFSLPLSDLFSELDRHGNAPQ